MIVYTKTSSGKPPPRLGLQRYAQAVAWCAGRAPGECRNESEKTGALRVMEQPADLLQLIGPPFGRTSFNAGCGVVSTQCNQLRKKV